MHRKSAAGLKTRDFAFDIKAVKPDGYFTGYGSVFGVKDSYGEVVQVGAFKESISARQERGRKLPILWQHRSGEPLGVYDVVKEDATGLWLEGRLLIDEVARAKEAHALMKAGAVTGLSIGYFVIDDSWNEKDQVRMLKKLDLQETSIVTFPANDEARVEVVKNRIDACDSLKDIEALLREAGGFSRGDATAMVARVKALAHGDRDAETKAALDILKQGLRL